MKLRATIVEEVQPDGTSVIMQFEGDPRKQHFEVHFRDWNPYQNKMRKWDLWELKIAWETEIFEDPKGKKSYFTHLIGSKAVKLSGILD